MPIEIRELIITAEIESGNSDAQTTPTAGAGLTENQLQEIVDRVVAVLKQKDER
jgi:hypothetical protein